MSDIKETVFSTIRNLGRARGLTIDKAIQSRYGFYEVNGAIAELEREGKVRTWMGDSTGEKVNGFSPVMWCEVVESVGEEVKA